MYYLFLGMNADNNHYVNKLSIWTAYYMFLLSVVFFQNAGGIPISTLANIFIDVLISESFKFLSI